MIRARLCCTSRVYPAFILENLNYGVRKKQEVTSSLGLQISQDTPGTIH